MSYFVYIWPYIYIWDLCLISLILYISFKDHGIKRPRPNSNKPTCRDIIVEDDTDQVRCTLWRDSASANVRLGDHVLIRDGTFQFSRYHNTITCSVNYIDEIKVIIKMFRKKIYNTVLQNDCQIYILKSFFLKGQGYFIILETICNFGYNTLIHLTIFLKVKGILQFWNDLI